MSFKEFFGKKVAEFKEERKLSNERNKVRKEELRQFEATERMKADKKAIVQKYHQHHKVTSGGGIISNNQSMFGFTPVKKKKKEESPYSSDSIGKMFDFKF
jgi:hypothetical protein